MKKKILVGTLIFVILIPMIVIAMISPDFYKNSYLKISELFSKKNISLKDEKNKTKSLDSKEDLIEKLKEWDKKLKNSIDKSEALYDALALIEKKDEFKTDEVLELLKQSNDCEVLETALVEIYIKLGGDSSELLSLLYNSDLSVSAKENIIIKLDLSNEELEKIHADFDNSYSEIAIKKLAMDNPKLAYEISEKILLESKGKISDHDLYTAALGLGFYFSKCKEDNLNKKPVIDELIKHLENRKNSKNDLIRDQLVYTLSKSRDFEVFKYLIFNDDIDEELKISAIENNLELMIKKIKYGLDEEGKKCILASMKIMPTLEVGEALEEYYNKNISEKDAEVVEIIKYIKEHGVEGVLKEESSRGEKSPLSHHRTCRSAYGGSIQVII